MTDANALQTLREYALTYKISQFTIKWYCSGTTHNTFQLTVKAEGDPIVPGAEITRDPVDLSKLTADYVAQDGDVLTGTLGGNYQISLAPGAVVTLNGVTINGTNDGNYNWAGITLTGNAILVLADGSKNVVKGFFEDARESLFLQHVRSSSKAIREPSMPAATEEAAVSVAITILMVATSRFRVAS